MNLSKKNRAIAETAIETVLGLAAGAPVALATTGTSQQFGTGAVVLAVSVAVTNLAHVPAVERFLDRVLGKGGEAQLVSLAEDLQEHLAAHPGTSMDQGPVYPSATSAGTALASSPVASATGQDASPTPESPANSSGAAGSTPEAGPSAS